MKTKQWILIFSVFAVLCAVLSGLLFLGGEEKTLALVYSDGNLVQTVDLTKNGQYYIEYGHEWNVLTVENGKIAVTSASCDNGDCIHTGARNHGAPIVCLPNRLVIEFSDAETLDAVIK